MTWEDLIVYSVRGTKHSKSSTFVYDTPFRVSPYPAPNIVAVYALTLTVIAIWILSENAPSHSHPITHIRRMMSPSYREKYLPLVTFNVSGIRLFPKMNINILFVYYQKSNQRHRVNKNSSQWCKIISWKECMTESVCTYIMYVFCS